MEGSVIEGAFSKSPKSSSSPDWSRPWLPAAGRFDMELSVDVPNAEEKLNELVETVGLKSSSEAPDCSDVKAPHSPSCESTRESVGFALSMQGPSRFTYILGISNRAPEVF
jgi:hypothetical protein